MGGGGAASPPNGNAAKLSYTINARVDLMGVVKLWIRPSKPRLVEWNMDDSVCSLAVSA